MQKICFILLASAALSLVWRAQGLAWMGFDAQTSNLVEITPDLVPSRGAPLVVRDLDQDCEMDCLVEDVVRNSATVELQVVTADGKQHTLVMEAP